MEQDPVMDRLSRPRSHASLWRWISPSGTMWTEHERGGFLKKKWGDVFYQKDGGVALG